MKKKKTPPKRKKKKKERNKKKKKILHIRIQLTAPEASKLLFSPCSSDAKNIRIKLRSLDCKSSIEAWLRKRDLIWTLAVLW